MTDQREKAIEAAKKTYYHCSGAERPAGHHVDDWWRAAIAEFERVMAEGEEGVTDEVFQGVYQRTVDFIAGRFGDKETYRVFGRFLLEAVEPPQFTEDERKALIFTVDHWRRTKKGTMADPTLKSARAKLERP